MYSTILWATDASPEADTALHAALELLSEEGTLVAFHCDQRFVGSHVAGMPVLPDETDRRRHIEEQVADVERRGIAVREVVETTVTDPAHAIARSADELGVDAIVCGTRSLHGLPAVLDGSVAARVLKHATVPVVVVPARVAARQQAPV